MRKVFIDGGANNGSSINLFREKLDPKGEFEIFSFEPNPKFAKNLSKKGVNFSNKALWIYDGETNFFIKGDLGSTLFKDKTTGGKITKTLTVKCIDLSKFIQDNFTSDDYIILKLDVEGAEFDILDRLIEDKTINWIDELYGEFHGHKIGRYDIKLHEEYREKIRSSCGLEMVNWSAGSKKIG